MVSTQHLEIRVISQPDTAEKRYYFETARASINPTDVYRTFWGIHKLRCQDLEDF